LSLIWLTVWVWRRAFRALDPKVNIVAPRDWLSFLEVEFVPTEMKLAKTGEPAKIPDLGGRDPTSWVI